MPFTPSHAVLALPFIRTPLVPAAIAIGAMTPDLPLFVRMLPLPYSRTHDLAWLPATIALAFVLLLVWRCVLRPAVRELSPRWLSARLPAEWDAPASSAWRQSVGIPRPGSFSGRALALTLVSLVIGVLSHIAWDLFTHEGRWGVKALPLLDQQWGPLTGYRWLQHGSSAIGLLIIGIWVIVWLRNADGGVPVQRVLSDPVRWIWWASLPTILVSAWAGGLAAFGPLDLEFTFAHLAYRVLPPACAIWGALTVGLAIVVQAVRSRRAG